MDDFVTFAEVSSNVFSDFIKSNSFVILFGGPLLLLLILLVIFYLNKTRKFQKDSKLINQALKDASLKEDSESNTSSESGSDTLPQKESSKSSSISFFKTSLTKTRDNFKNQIFSLFSRKPQLDSSMLDEIYSILYRADIGVSAVEKLIYGLKQRLTNQNIDIDTLKTILKEESKKILLSSFQTESNLEFDSDSNSNSNSDLSTSTKAVLIIGVNGVGKTTTCAKLAYYITSLGKTCLLCAADTYRAAAIDQLKIWADRQSIPLVANKSGSDPASVVYDGVQSAKAHGINYLIIDTAGRLHNKKELMDELKKIYKVINKNSESNPIQIKVWVVIDATTGQNAFRQVEAFNEVAKVEGLIVTKLDGTAKGGVLLGLADKFKLPIKFVGVGEKMEDLRPFDIDSYTDSLF